MKILDTKIPEVKIIEPDVSATHRGWFMETWSLPKYEALHFNSMQDNESFTAKKGTLRGIHFQQDPMAQAKIVRVVRGCRDGRGGGSAEGLTHLFAVGIRGAQRRK